MQMVGALLALVVAWPGVDAVPAVEPANVPASAVNERAPQARLLPPTPLNDSALPIVDTTTESSCRSPHWPEVWGLLGAGGFAYGERMAPNGRPFDPLFALDLDLNVGLLPDQRLYLFATSNFWTERPGARTDPSQGIFDFFSKREWDFTTGLAWNVYGPAELRVFGYALNNLNRGVSVTMPSGYADGVGIEGRWYLSIEDRYDVAKRGFLAVGYLPSKVLIDANGNEFPPALYVQAYLTHDLPAVRSYLFGGAAGVTDDDLSLRMVYGDAGLAARPFLALPALEFRVGATDTYDVRVQHNNRVLVYGAVRVVF